MKSKKLLAIALSVVMTLGLASCAPSADETSSETATETATEATTEEATEETATETPAETATAAPEDSSAKANAVAATFPIEVKNEAAAIDGGVLNVALAATSGFKGLLNPCLYEGTDDAAVLGWFTESLLSFDDKLIADQDGAATYTYDKDAKTITLTVKDGVKWHDLQPVTADDLVYAYELICHKDYDGFRFDDGFFNVVGVKEYREGTADKISGLVLSPDKKTLTIQFVEFFPSILAAGFWTSPIPRHYYGDIAVKEQSAHEKNRVTPIGFGPFKVKSIVPGESVEFERFDEYWLGKPKLAGVHLEVVNPDLVPAAMEEGKFDIATFNTQVYPDYKNPTNYAYLGQIQMSYNYTGFKLGKWDATAGTNVVDPNAKMANLNLRKAIGYAVNNNELGEQMYNGLRFLATTVITPRHADYQNKELAGYVYDPEKSKQLLDEAGYKDVDGDGFREDPNGEQFTITYAMMDGPGADTWAQFKMQAWTEVGLRTELYNGRLTEFNAFYEAVEADDPAIDMYDGGWVTGFDPNPDSLWGHNSLANYSRYTSPTFDEIIANISSDKMWDPAYSTEQYMKWQQAFFDEAPAIPTLWRISLEAVNNRVKNYSLVATDLVLSSHLIELTAEDPVKK